jgi:hypothetical protein
MTDFLRTLGSTGVKPVELHFSGQGTEFETADGKRVALNPTGRLALTLDLEELQRFITSVIHSLTFMVKEFEATDGSTTISLDTGRAVESTFIGTGSFPADQVMNFHLIVESPELFPGKKLRSKNHASLSGRLDSFPPQGDLYQLADPVELEDADNPGEVLARINNFPVRVTHQ